MFGFPWPVVLPSVVTAMAASLITWFAAQFSAVARLQKTLLDASRQLVEQSQRQRVLDIAHALELDKIVAEREGEIQRLRQEIRALQQWKKSAKNYCKRNGVILPDTEEG